MYDELQSLKLESINYQRAGVDDGMTAKMHERDTYVYDRIKELEKQMLTLVIGQEKIVFNNTTVEMAKRQQDKFYTEDYLVDWVRLKNDIHIMDGLVNGEVIYIPKPI